MILKRCELIFCCGTAIAITGMCLSCKPVAIKKVAVAPIAEDFIERAGLKNYRNWQKTNKNPVYYSIKFITSCSDSLYSKTFDLPSEHQGRYITVYVNEVGKSAMMTENRLAFPVGSVIVKQKMKTQDPASTELSTVMMKREPGYNPGNGDWEYAVIDAKGARTTSEGKLENCQKCHMNRSKYDFVFRTGYLSEKLNQKLKP